MGGEPATVWQSSDERGLGRPAGGVGGMGREASRPAVVRAWVERTCAAQGLPADVTDPATVERVVAPLAQTRQTGSIRSGSNLARPGTAG